jgi:preprotein translocase subunit SecG
MQTVILVIHLMVAIALVAVVLWQRSEGGALGIGGGGGGFLTGRGTANLLTRMTAILAAGFFLTSITLTLISRHTGPAGSILDRQVAPAAAPGAPATPGAATPAAPGAPATDTPRGGILDKLK